MSSPVNCLRFIRSQTNLCKTYDCSAYSLLICVRFSSRVIIDVLRQAAKSCIMKRQLPQANLLIRQAMSLADELYSVDQHPRYADTLIDYGFFLLNFDCVRESVKMYEKALNIRKKVFGKNNLLVAMVYEDLAYAQYVKEYNSGNFYQPRFVFYYFTRSNTC